MTDPETDEQFEDFLKRRTVLPGGMSVDEKLEPPGALDDIVVKQAREAIKAQPPPNRAPRWALPVALAATVLLCLSVVLNVRLNTNRPTANLQRMTAVNDDKAPDSPRPDVTSAPRDNHASADSTSALGNNHAPTARAESSATARADALAARSAREHADAPAQAEKGGAAHTDTPALARSAGERERSESVAGDIPSHEVILPETKVAGSPAPRPPVIAEPAAGPPPSASASSGPAATAPAPPALAKRKANEVAAAPHPQDPKVWLQQIEALRSQGKNPQADAEMRLFRAEFPGYAAKPVPPASSEPPK
jgi:hypothetical protein